MKLKNKHTIALFHALLIVAVLAAAVGGIIGFISFYVWTGWNPAWVLVTAVFAGLYKMCAEGVNDSDDWL